MDCSPGGPSAHGISQARIPGVGGHLLRQGIFPPPGIEPTSPASPVLAGGLFATEPPGKLIWQLKMETKMGCLPVR